MGSLGKISILFGGELEVLNILPIKVINKVPFAFWEVTVPVSLSKRPQTTQDQNQRQMIYSVKIDVAVLKIFYGTNPVAESFTEFFNIAPNISAVLNFKMNIPLEALQFLEAYRHNDIILNFQINGIYSLSPQYNDVAMVETPFSLQFEQKYSQKDWLDLLRETGYSDKWIVEIDRPKIEGFSESLKFLENAGTKLYEKNDPPGVLSELRNAWNALKPLIESKKDEIDKKIDEGSPGEPNKRSKSERIEEIKKAIIQFLQIGPHQEGYNVTYSDALLAYRLFISLLQYYSGLLSESEK